MSAYRDEAQRAAPAHDASGMVPDDVLVRWLHGELDEPAAHTLAEHVADCPACQTRLHTLQERSRRVSRALESADFAAPAAREWERILERVRAEEARPGPTRTRGLLAAGMVLAIVGMATLAGSAAARGWMADQWTRITGGGTDATLPAASTGPEGTAREPGRADLAFPATGPGIDIVLEQSQASGALTLRFGEGARATVSVSGGGRERLIVGDGDLRVVNPPDSEASYHMTLPADVERASVRIGRFTPVEITRRGAGHGSVTVDLVVGGLVRSGAVRDEN